MSDIRIPTWFALQCDSCRNRWLTSIATCHATKPTRKKELQKPLIPMVKLAHSGTGQTTAAATTTTTSRTLYLVKGQPITELGKSRAKTEAVPPAGTPVVTVFRWPECCQLESQRMRTVRWWSGTCSWTVLARGRWNGTKIEWFLDAGRTLWIHCRGARGKVIKGQEQHVVFLLKCAALIASGKTG